MELKEPEWAKEIVKYLNTGELPDKKDEGRKVKERAARFIRVEGVLYKQGFTVTLLRCISP